MVIGGGQYRMAGLHSGEVSHRQNRYFSSFNDQYAYQGIPGATAASSLLPTARNVSGKLLRSQSVNRWVAL